MKLTNYTKVQLWNRYSERRDNIIADIKSRVYTPSKYAVLMQWVGDLPAMKVLIVLKETAKTITLTADIYPFIGNGRMSDPVVKTYSKSKIVNEMLGTTLMDVLKPITERDLWLNDYLTAMDSYLYTLPRSVTYRVFCGSIFTDYTANYGDAYLEVLREISHDSGINFLKDEQYDENFYQARMQTLLAEHNTYTTQGYDTFYSDDNYHIITF